MTDETKTFWLGAIERLGVPIVFLVVLIVAFWRGSVYVATSVVQPLLKTHIEYVESSMATLTEMRQGGRESLLRIEKTTAETLELLKEKQ
jgi:hypothetical protein